MGASSGLCYLIFFHLAYWGHSGHNKHGTALASCDACFSYFFMQQQMGLNVITYLIIGYIYPDKPIANMVFNAYKYISMTQALYFLQDFKLGHYMKIPPRAMFVVQVKFYIEHLFFFQLLNSCTDC